MGSGDKPGFFASRGLTIILIAFLVILLVVLIWIQSTEGGFSNFFDKFKKKKSTEPKLKSLGMSLQLCPEAAPRLELAEDGLIKISKAELA